MSNEKKETKTVSLDKENKVVEVTPLVDKEKLKRWENVVSTFIGDTNKLTGDRLSAALLASLNHFLYVGNRSATEVNKLYHCLMVNGMAAPAKQVRLIASKVFAIELTYDKDSGVTKHKYKPKAFAKIGESPRTSAIKALEKGDIKKFAATLEEDKEPQVVTIVEQVEKFNKSFDRVFNNFKEFSLGISDKEDIGILWKAIRDQQQMLSQLEDALDKAKAGVADSLMESSDKVA